MDKIPVKERINEFGTRTGVVYAVNFPEEDMSYIGNSIRILNQRARHKNNSNNPYVREFVKKHGWRNDRMEILATVDLPNEKDTKRVIKMLERGYIKVRNNIYPNGCNLQDGGKQGAKVHDITKKQIGENNGNYWKGKKQPKSSVDKRRKSILKSYPKQEMRQEILKRLDNGEIPPDIARIMGIPLHIVNYNKFKHWKK